MIKKKIQIRGRPRVTRNSYRGSLLSGKKLKKTKKKR